MPVRAEAKYVLFIFTNLFENGAKEQTETITERKLKVLENICGDKRANKLFH